MDGSLYGFGFVFVRSECLAAKGLSMCDTIIFSVLRDGSLVSFSFAGQEVLVVSRGTLGYVSR